MLLIPYSVYWEVQTKNNQEFKNIARVERGFKRNPCCQCLKYVILLQIESNKP